jgi:ribonuclease E
LHGDPVDSTSAAGRKAESGGRRGKRGKKGGRVEDVAVAKVPAHPAGEHPMFKAMAAANGKHDEETDGEAEEKTAAAEVAELDPDTIRQAYVEADDEELEDEDFDDTDEDESDEDESDEDEIDLDADDEDDGIDDDIEVINDDTDDTDDSDDSDDEDYGDDDSDEDDSDEDDESDADEDEEPAAVTPFGGRHRRRAAMRPAGPPIHEG